MYISRCRFSLLSLFPVLTRGAGSRVFISSWNAVVSVKLEDLTHSYPVLRLLDPTPSPPCFFSSPFLRLSSLSISFLPSLIFSFFIFLLGFLSFFFSCVQLSSRFLFILSFFCKPLLFSFKSPLTRGASGSALSAPKGPGIGDWVRVRPVSESRSAGDPRPVIDS